LGFFRVRCEVVGFGVRPLISALIVVLSSASGICDLYCMNLLTKFHNTIVELREKIHATEITDNDEGFGSCNIISSCRIRG
jgi:hypothetical protein